MVSGDFMTSGGDQVSTAGPVIVSRDTGRGRVAGLACLVLLLAGCAGGSAGEDEGIPQLSLSPVSAASPAVSSAKPSTAGSGSARDQQIAAGAAAIRAYRQMIFDIYADPNPDVQDMRKVATGELLQQDMDTIQRNIDSGWRDTPGTVSIKWVKPVSIGGKEMRLFACVDPNGIQAGTGDEPAKTAQRLAADYVLVQREDNWLVADIWAHSGAKTAQKC